MWAKFFRDHRIVALETCSDQQTKSFVEQIDCTVARLLPLLGGSHEPVGSPQKRGQLETGYCGVLAVNVVGEDEVCDKYQWRSLSM